MAVLSDRTPFSLAGFLVDESLWYHQHRMWSLLLLALPRQVSGCCYDWLLKANFRGGAQIPVDFAEIIGLGLSRDNTKTSRSKANTLDCGGGLDCFCGAQT